jgi:hypothetical protein
MARTAAVRKPDNTALVTQDMTKEIEDLRNRLLAPTGNRIKLENKQFHLPNGEKSNAIDIVIVDFVYANKYYDKPYDQNVISPPACFAISPEPGSLTPSTNSLEIQSQVGCAGCPMNQFGTKGAGKACQNRVLVAVLAADATSDTPIYVLDLSPTVIKPFSAYVSAVARSLNRPPYGVVTHVECNPDVKWDVPVFSQPQLIEDAEYIAMVRSRKQEARELLSIEPDVEAIRAANDARAPVRKLIGGKKRR